MAKGMTEDETTEQMRIYINNALLTNEYIRKGAAQVLDSYKGPLTKSAMARVMKPDILATIIEHTIHESKCAGACIVRKFHPVHQALTEEFEQLMSQHQMKSASKLSGIRSLIARFFPAHAVTNSVTGMLNTHNHHNTKTASFLESADTPTSRQLYDRFSELPLSEKVLLVGGLGGAFGGLSNAILPRASEAFTNPAARLANGAFRGAAMGTGAVLGGVAGDVVGSAVNSKHNFFGPPQEHRLAQLTGAGLGLLGTHKMLNQIPF